MSRRAAVPCLIRAAQGWLERVSTFRWLPLVMDLLLLFTPTPGERPCCSPEGCDGWNSSSRLWLGESGGQQQVCEAESEVQHLLTAGDPFGNRQIQGVAGSVQCLEDAGQGGHAASLSGWQTAQSLVYQWNNWHWFMSKMNWELLTVVFKVALNLQNLAHGG